MDGEGMQRLGDGCAACRTERSYDGEVLAGSECERSGRGEEKEMIGKGAGCEKGGDGSGGLSQE